MDGKREEEAQGTTNPVNEHGEKRCRAGGQHGFKRLRIEDGGNKTRAGKIESEKGVRRSIEDHPLPPLRSMKKMDLPHETTQEC